MDGVIHQELYDKLIEKIRLYHPSREYGIVERAYNIAVEAHVDQFRESGEPYIIHPLSVAIILAELELDLESIIAGILHDVIEDTKYTYDDIVKLFGEEVAVIVDGVTKLENIPITSSVEEVQAENYRKMFLSMSKDIRVILVKIADRLHNMRTLKYRPVEKQKKVAQETIDIYCPLAHRLGISKMRYELEDLSFKYLEPESYYDLADKIMRKQGERQEFVAKIVTAVKDRLLLENIDSLVEGRPKHFFSIYKKMLAQNKTLDQIYDLFAIRVIVNDVQTCYHVLGIVHEMYTPVPGRVKDYIAMPKSNKYQSLHTTVIGHEGEPFEVQIRTWEMHRTSEYGIAAHWKYKERKGGQVDPESEEAKLSWLKQILEWQKEYSDNKEYLEALKTDLNVYKDHVYCFTPKGDVISLLSGSTPIDFAYVIHSSVGHKIIGARVNGRIVNYDYQLQMGDRVEILTSGNSKGPSKDWLKIVKTSQARSKINQWFKKENKDENILKGKELLEKEAKKKNHTLAELIGEEQRVKVVLNRFGFVDWDSLCAGVGHGGVKEGQVINRLIDEVLAEQSKHAVVEDIIINVTAENKKIGNKKSGIIVKGEDNLNVRFPKCCSPVPGDEIVGFVTRGRGMTIHRTDCANILTLDEIDRYRLIEAEWQLPDKTGDRQTYYANIKIICDERDTHTLLADVTRVLTDDKIPIKAFSSKSDNRGSIINARIEIRNRETLDKLCDRLMKLKGVIDIERASNN